MPFSIDFALTVFAGFLLSFCLNHIIVLRKSTEIELEPDFEIANSAERVKGTQEVKPAEYTEAKAWPTEPKRIRLSAFKAMKKKTSSLAKSLHISQLQRKIEESKTVAATDLIENSDDAKIESNAVAVQRKCIVLPPAIIPSIPEINETTTNDSTIKAPILSMPSIQKRPLDFGYYPDAKRMKFIETELLKIQWMPRIKRFIPRVFPVNGQNDQLFPIAYHERQFKKRKARLNDVDIRNNLKKPKPNPPRPIPKFERRKRRFLPKPFSLTSYLEGGRTSQEKPANLLSAEHSFSRRSSGPQSFLGLSGSVGTANPFPAGGDAVHQAALPLLVETKATPAVDWNVDVSAGAPGSPPLQPVVMCSQSEGVATPNDWHNPFRPDRDPSNQLDISSSAEHSFSRRSFGPQSYEELSGSVGESNPFPAGGDAIHQAALPLLVETEATPVVNWNDLRAGAPGSPPLVRPVLPVDGFATPIIRTAFGYHELVCGRREADLSWQDVISVICQYLPRIAFDKGRPVSFPYMLCRMILREFQNNVELLIKLVRNKAFYPYLEKFHVEVKHLEQLERLVEVKTFQQLQNNANVYIPSWEYDSWLESLRFENWTRTDGFRGWNTVRLWSSTGKPLPHRRRGMTDSSTMKKLEISEIFPRFFFDDSVCFDSNKQDLILKASRQPLARDQITELGALVKDDLEIYQTVLDYNIGLGIVINNPKLAIELLISKSATTKIIFSGCLETWTSIQTIDVIAESTKLGGEFLYDFVDFSVSKLSTLDQRQQERMAKIIFLMILSLQKAKIDILPLKIVLNPFCLQFSRIKEAVELYSILQN